MRPYDVVSGILLILSIIDFALAAPVLVQEKRAGIDAVHMIPKDVITVLGKRMDEDLRELTELLDGLVRMFGVKTEDSAGTVTHASSSSAPLGPGHGSTNVAHAPEPNKPTYNSDDELGLIYSPTPLRYYLDHEGTTAPSGSSAKGARPDNQPTYNSGDELGLIPSPTSLGYGSSHEGAIAPKPNPNPKPETDDFDRMSLLYHPPPKLTLPKKFGQADEPQVEEQKPGPSKPGPSDAEPSNQG